MGAASLRLVCLKSLTKPTIWTSSAGVPRDVRLPTASRPRPNFLANCSLTIATLGAFSESAGVNSPPEISGTPSVSLHEDFRGPHIP